MSKLKVPANSVNYVWKPQFRSHRCPALLGNRKPESELVLDQSLSLPSSLPSSFRKGASKSLALPLPQVPEDGALVLLFLGLTQPVSGPTTRLHTPQHQLAFNRRQVSCRLFHQGPEAKGREPSKLAQKQSSFQQAGGKEGEGTPQVAHCLRMGFQLPTNSLFHGGGSGPFGLFSRAKGSPCFQYWGGGTLKTSDHHPQAGLCLRGVHQGSCPASL